MTEVFILILLIFVNALFVMSEIALVSARKTKLEQLANKGNINAKAALKLAENPEVFLSTAQIFITLIAILTGLYSGEKFSGHLQPFIEKISFPASEKNNDHVSVLLVADLVDEIKNISGVIKMISRLNVNIPFQLTIIGGGRDEMKLEWPGRPGGGGRAISSAVAAQYLIDTVLHRCEHICGRSTCQPHGVEISDHGVENTTLILHGRKCGGIFSSCSIFSAMRKGRKFRAADH